MKKILSFFAAMLVVFAVNAKTTTIGPETPGGTGTNLLKAALIAADAGDVIVMKTGTYFEDKTYGVGYVDFDKDITVMAEAGARPVIQPEAFFRVKGGSNVKLQGLVLDGSQQGEYSYFLRIYDNAANKLELEDCEFMNSQNICIQVESSRHLDACKINNCYFHDCAKSAIHFAKTGSTHQACDKLEIYNSTFANFTGVPEALIAFYNKDGSETAESCQMIIDHCTFYNYVKSDASSTYAFVDSRKSWNVAISNCIFAEPTTNMSASTQLYGGAVSNCLSYQTKGHRTSANLNITNDMTGDPKFVDAANADYTLGAGSAALGVGTDASNLGDPRWWPVTKYYMKNNWGRADDWTWKEMTKDGDNYKLENVVFGGTGVNYSTDVDATDPAFIAYGSDKFLGDAFDELDTVNLVLNPTAGTVTVSLVGAYIPTVANGYYLVGKFSGVAAWDLADLNASKLFAENPGNPGEYMLDYTFAVNDEIKVVKVYRDAYKNWYHPTLGNYSITDAMAGEATVYFNPDGNTGWGDYFYLTVIKKAPTSVDNVNGDVKAIKVIENGQMYIIRDGVKYNAIGAVAE